MYAPPGISFSDIGDIELLPVGDELHLFHLTLPNHDVVQHMVSSDGLAWRRLPAALRTGDPGDADSDQIWTMSVTGHDGRYVMLYTALSTCEGGNVQRTALAISDDLIHWTKSERNPVAEADGRWYEALGDTHGSVSWRDPKPIRAGDTWYATVCAREKDGPFMRRGAIGLIASSDLLTWEVRPPLFAPRRYWDLECPQLFTIGDRYYLTAAIMEDGTQRYWMAGQFDGPYEVPPDGGILAPLGHYAGRVCTWQGRTIFGCWHDPRPRQRAMVPPSRIDWAATYNPYGKFIVAPLVLEPRPDGSLARRTFPAWDAYRTAEPQPILPARETLLHGSRRATDNWQLDTLPGSMEIIAGAESAGDCTLEGALTLDAIAGGLAFRLADDSSGYFITVRSGSTAVALHKWLRTEDPFDRRPWFQYVTVQEAELLEPLARNRRYRFQLRSIGPYIELSLDGEVVLAALSGERITGRIGIWAESGSIAAADVTLTPMRQPVHA